MSRDDDYTDPNLHDTLQFMEVTLEFDGKQYTAKVTKTNHFPLIVVRARGRYAAMSKIHFKLHEFYADLAEQERRAFKK